MGIETILFAAFAGLQAISAMSQADAQAEATVKQGEVAAANRAKQAQYDAARQTASFLASGLTLDGTPRTVENETFKTGQEDVTNIRQAYDAQSKSIISSGRQKAISDIMGGISGMSSGGSAGSMFDTGLSYMPESVSYGLNSAGFGNDAYAALSLKDARADGV